MSETTPNMGLVKWANSTDVFNHTELAGDWDKVDAHDHSSTKGVQIGSAGIANGAIGTAQLAANAVTAAKIANGTITSTQVAGSVGTYQAGTEATRQAIVSPATGLTFITTDTGCTYVSDGTNWHLVSGSGTAAIAYVPSGTALSWTGGGTPQKISYANVEYNPNSFFDATTNHRYNCPTAGVYQVSGYACFRWDPTVFTTHTVFIRKTSAGPTTTDYVLSDAPGPSGTSSSPTLTLSGTRIFQCAANDFLEMYGLTTTANSVSTTPNGGMPARMEIIRIG